ncbi:hypothetical protein PIB30_021005 [Stylosanthes scabra]|uniref:Uncharacterized protein n=1 Tax=Stylosanthes scabra TaxID=79078 RepID=A0ABU6T912_9FABA|nr:hypothetical protein [Stylosanthes scabra]
MLVGPNCCSHVSNGTDNANGLCGLDMRARVTRHHRVSTLRELQQVTLYNIDGRFMEITEVGYRFLSPQSNRRPMWMLVWLLNDEHVRVTFECHRRLMAETIMEFLVVAAEIGTSSVPQSSESLEPPINVTPLCIVGSVGDRVEAELGNSDFDSDYLGDSDSSSEWPNDDECILETLVAVRPRYILPPPLPIPSLANVPCFYQQLDTDVGRVRDPLHAGLADDYNTNGGVEF